MDKLFTIIKILNYLEKNDINSFSKFNEFIDIICVKKKLGLKLYVKIQMFLLNILNVKKDSKLYVILFLFTFLSPCDIVYLVLRVIPYFILFIVLLIKKEGEFISPSFFYFLV